MTYFPRLVAFVIAIAGVFDPAFTLRRSAPLPIEIRLPSTEDPDFERASQLSASLLTRLGTGVAPGTGDASRAIVAIANASVENVGAPLFAVSIPRSIPSLRFVTASAETAIVGQQTNVSVKVDAKGMRGATTQLSLLSGATAVLRLDHRWATDDETFDARMPFTPTSSGSFILRVSAATANVASADVDVPLLVRAQRFRVVIHEPRPSWSAAFMRQALEEHESFEILGAARTSRGVATLTSGGPELSSSQLDDADAVIVSGLDVLSAADERALERFVTIRGGTLILAPDARLPDRLCTLFGLPAFEEVLLERPMTISAGEAKLLASEFVLPRPDAAPIRTLATVGHGGAVRPVVFVAYRGKGQVVVSGALDAWRFRAAHGSAFTSFWRAIVADAAAAAIPRLAVHLEPMLARPGQQVTARLAVRETEWTRTTGGFRMPAVSASLIDASGRSTPVRLWPGPAAGEYISRFPAPAQGNYDVRISANGATHDTILAVRAVAATVPPDQAAALALVAKSSGGAVIPAADLDRVAATLRAFERPIVERRTHPMRSAWWIVPFAGLLSVEWIQRRRRGLP